MDNYSDTFNEDFPHSSADYITINDESSEPSINGNINGNIEKSSSNSFFNISFLY